MLNQILKLVIVMMRILTEADKKTKLYHVMYHNKYVRSFEAQKYIYLDRHLSYTLRKISDFPVPSRDVSSQNFLWP
jgi:hypothetical protein